MPVLIGCGTDGATVNIAQQDIRGRLQTVHPWLVWSWCYAHRLELACRDAFTSMLFTYIEEMLLRLYYLYEKSPKKIRELGEIEDLKHVLNSQRVVIFLFAHRGPGGLTTSVKHCSVLLIGMVPILLT